jgi:5-methylcytosine-specific restriction endonuclease McrA
VPASIIVCADCGDTKPLCAKGLCRPCYAHRAYLARPPKPYVPKPRATYECERCGKSVTKRAGPSKQFRYCEKCLRYFWRKAHSDDYNGRAKARRAANPEFYRQYEREYRARDPELHKARARRYRQRHPERAREHDRRQYEKNAERKRAYALQWQKDNPARHAANERARRAKQAGLFVEYVHPLVVLELHDGVCGICGGDVDPGNFHVDHIEPMFFGGEHSYANTQPSHPACNMSKGTRIAA